MKTKVKIKTNDVKEIERVTGLTLHVTNDGDSVDGYVNFVSLGKGLYEAEIVLYEEDIPPTFQKLKKDGIDYVVGNKTHFKVAKSIDVEKLKEKVGDII